MVSRYKLLIVSAGVCGLLGLGFQAAQKAPAKDPLLAGYEVATVAAVADAVDQITGQRGYMSHDMRPRTVTARVVGRAVTAYLEPTTPEKATPALSTAQSTAMIDNANPGEVGIIVIKDGLDVAGIGGLMATAAKVRGMAGVGRGEAGRHHRGGRGRGGAGAAGASGGGSAAGAGDRRTGDEDAAVYPAA